MAWKWSARINLILSKPVELFLILFGEKVFIASELRSINVRVFPLDVILIFLRDSTSRYKH